MQSPVLEMQVSWISCLNIVSSDQNHDIKFQVWISSFIFNYTYHSFGKICLLLYFAFCIFIKIYVYVMSTYLIDISLERHIHTHMCVIWVFLEKWFKRFTMPSNLPNADWISCWTYIYIWCLYCTWWQTEQSLMFF